MFKKKSKKILESNLNHNLDTITLSSWIKVSEGQMEFISKNGELNDECEDAWYQLQDEYISLFGGDSAEMKQYKFVCVEYTNALRDWIMNPNLIGAQYTLVNDLFNEKEILQRQIFKDETDKIDYGLLIGKVQLKTPFRIDTNTFLAKEFFNIIKALNDGRATN